MTDKTKKIDALRKALPERERRMLTVDDAATVTLRAVDGEPPKIGMFVPYNRDSVLLMGFTERIAPGFFTRSVKTGKSDKRNKDIVALWNHDPNWVLGRQANGTLEFNDTKDGMEALATLDAEDTMHRHFARRVERRDVTGTSFGFETVKDEWEYHDDDSITRTLIEGKIYDFSPVTYPAYPESDTEAREQRAAIDIASVRTGVDLTELATLLRGATAGKIASEQRDVLAGWVTKLEGFLPPPPVPETDWAARLALRERVLRIS